MTVLSISDGLKVFFAKVSDIYFLSKRQVLMPKIRYRGQFDSRPVTSGTMPSQPHQPMTPAAAKTINNAPAAMRMALSMPPTFYFMVLLLIILYKNFFIYFKFYII